MTDAYLFSEWQCGNCGRGFPDKNDAEECCKEVKA
jgi:hypothetical protein